MAHPHRIAAWLPDLRKLRETVEALERAGFDRSQFGVLGRKSLFEKPQIDESDARIPALHNVDRKQGDVGAFRNVLVDGLGYAGAIVAAGSVILAGGGLGVALLATAATAANGGLVGALLAHGFESGLAQTLSRKVDQGRLLLWITARDGNQNLLALAVLARAGADITDAAVPGTDVAA
jgi:hypothetical protein